MDFVQLPVFGQSVKPGLGLRFRGNYWAFFDKRTELSPWLALHRESINDTELDELMLHGLVLPSLLVLLTPSVISPSSTSPFQ